MPQDLPKQSLRPPRRISLFSVAFQLFVAFVVVAGLHFAIASAREVGAMFARAHSCLQAKAQCTLPFVGLALLEGFLILCGMALVTIISTRGKPMHWPSIKDAWVQLCIVMATAVLISYLKF